MAVVDEYVTILLGNGSGSFMPAPGSPLALSAFGVSAATGDFNSDPRSDLAVGDAEGNVRVFLATASEWFVVACIVAGASAWRGSLLSRSRARRERMC